jgi:ABC-2 type transport system ATP-binding protein
VTQAFRCVRDTGRVQGSPAYEVRGVEKTYPGTDARANDGIDLDVLPGEVFGLLGPNGAGKSTLVRQLIGLQRPDRGSIRLFGSDVVADPTVASRMVAYLAQDEPALLELPVKLAVSTTARLRGMPRRPAAVAADDVVDELGLAAVAATPIARLSGGQRRLACFAAALAADRPVLILDEPTSGLDAVARRSVWSAVRRRRDQGATVVLVTHNVLEAEAVLDRVAVLDRGRVIACDSPGRLKAAVSDDVRLDLVWRQEPPASDPVVLALAARARVDGRRWSLRLPQTEAREALDRLMSGAALQAIDDFTLATPTLEDVYLALGGRNDDLERA